MLKQPNRKKDIVKMRFAEKINSFVCEANKLKFKAFGLYVNICLQCSWEDNANGGGTVSRGSISRSASNPSRRGGRGRSNRSGGQANDVTFMSATGEPIAGRCFVCGDPTHFANACPNRGR